MNGKKVKLFNLACLIIGHWFEYLGKAGQQGHRVWCKRCLNHFTITWAPEPKPVAVERRHGSGPLVEMPKREEAPLFAPVGDMSDAELPRTHIQPAVIAVHHDHFE